MRVWLSMSTSSPSLSARADHRDDVAGSAYRNTHIPLDSAGGREVPLALISALVAVGVMFLLELLF